MSKRPSIHKDAHFLVGCFANSLSSKERTYGLAVLQRDEIYKDQWSILFTLAGKGTLEDAAKYASRFLRDYALSGAVVMQNEWIAPDRMEAIKAETLKEELVREVILIDHIQNEAPGAGYAVYCACAAMMAAYSDHPYTKELQEEGKAVKLAKPTAKA